jgi:hypothetical protein
MRRLHILIPAMMLLGTACPGAETTATVDQSGNVTTASASQPPPSVPGLYTIRPDGFALIHGWDDATTTAPKEPRILSTIPFDILGGDSVRGAGFYIESAPNISQPIDLPKTEASFRFFVMARIAQHELPRFQVHLKDAEGVEKPEVLYDGFIQSLGRWRVVAPIPERFRGKFGIVELRVLNASPVEQKRTVFVDPVQIIEGTSQRSGSGLMD